MLIETCEECGFDGNNWTNRSAIDALAAVPHTWRKSIEGISTDDLSRRLRADRWSIAEYTNHVREAAFAMRFLVDIATEASGTDLGDLPGSEFSAEPRVLNIEVALTDLFAEVDLLCRQLRAVTPVQWDNSVTYDGVSRDVHWVVRHALHDLSHHVGDVVALREILQLDG